ncbi:MAG: hypothetical protein J7L15_08555, partial [Clostridiales bacterium]|nr:hypothetical protein [Clostridiales bacterium]
MLTLMEFQNYLIILHLLLWHGYILILQKMTIASFSDEGQLSYQIYIEDGKLYLLRLDGSSYVQYSTQVSVIEDKQWQHICIVFPLDSYIFYVDGIGCDADIGSGSTTPSSNENYHFSIGALYTDSGVSEYFYGKITEVSIHSVKRDFNYIKNYWQEEIVKIIDPETFEEVEITIVTGYAGDNGDRLPVFIYEVDEDYDYENGEVLIIRKDNNYNKVIEDNHYPSWEGDYSKIIKTHTGIVPGTYYITDPDDFVHEDSYSYRIYSKNTLGNYSYATDSKILSMIVEKGGSDFFPNIIGSIEIAGPDSFEGTIGHPGNKKVLLNWTNTFELDDRIARVRVYYSPTDYPT